MAGFGRLLTGFTPNFLLIDLKSLPYALDESAVTLVPDQRFVSAFESIASVRDTRDTGVRQLEQMRLDAKRIAALRQAPHAAAIRTHPNEELLGQLERALAAAIDRSRWHNSIPQPPIRLPNSDYKKLTTRLYLETVTLKQLATFDHNLQSNDPALHVSAINLTKRHPDTPHFDLDLAVSYLVYAPQERSQTSTRERLAGVNPNS